MPTIFDDLLRPMAVQPTSLAPQGGLKPPVKALLLDVYGTLLISGSGDIQADCPAFCDHTRDALEKLLCRFEISFPIEDLQSTLMAKIRETHCGLSQKGIQYPEVRIEKIWQSILEWPLGPRLLDFALAYELIVNPVWPMPHFHELIRACYRARLPLGIISNAQFYTVPTLRRFLGDPLESAGFDPELMIFSFREGVAKPSNLLFEKVVRRLAGKKIAPKQTAFVGNDLLNDIMPAKKAGFQTVLFSGDRRSLRLRKNDPRCAGLWPEMVITDLSQLQKHLIIED